MPVLRIFLLLFSFLITGCGSYYTVSVDSLRDDRPPAGASYVLVPGDERITESDLLFREIATLFSPAFHAKGYTIVPDRSAAHNMAKLSYWMEEPRVETDTTTVTRSYPVEVGRGKYRRIEYIHVQEPVVSTRTIYSVNLLIEAYELHTDKTQGRQIWRTALRCSGGTENFRPLLFSMAQVLPRVLGTKSYGLKRYEVFLGNDGEIEVKDEETDSLW